MEKSNQSLILGLVIGAVVVLAGGLFFYFGAGCADGDCLGLVRKAKIKAPTTINKPVAEQPKPTEAPAEELDLVKLFKLDTELEPIEVNNKTDLTKVGSYYALNKPDFMEIDYHRYEFGSHDIESKGTAVADVRTHQPDPETDVRATAIQNWRAQMNDNEVLVHLYDSHPYVVGANKNNVTVSAAFNNMELVGNPYVYINVWEYGIGPWDKSLVTSKSVPITVENARKYFETDPFTMTVDKNYLITAVVSVKNIPDHESESVYGWFSEVNLNIP